MTLSEGAVGFRYDADIEPVLPEVLWDMLIRMISRPHLCLAHSPQLCTGCCSMQIVQPADPFPRFLFVNPKSGGQIGEVAHQACCCGSVAPQTSCWHLILALRLFWKCHSLSMLKSERAPKPDSSFSVAWLCFQNWYIQPTISKCWERVFPTHLHAPGLTEGDSGDLASIRIRSIQVADASHELRKQTWLPLLAASCI